MRARRAEHRLGALLMPLAVWVSGCMENHEPCFGLRAEERLEIHVFSEYSEAAGYDFNLGRNVVTPPCQANLRLPADSSLDVRVVAQEEQGLSQSCLPNTVEVTAGSGLALGARAPWLLFGSENAAEILHSTHALTFEGCPGSWGFSIESRSSIGTDGNAFLPAPDSGYPPIVMHLGFKAGVRDSAECLQLLGREASVCTDYYVVELRRP